MEDILEENAALKYQNQWLIDVITKNISDLSNRIQKNSLAIDTNTEEVSSVKYEISPKTNLLHSNVQK